MAGLHTITLGDGSTFQTALPPERLAALGLPPVERPAGTSLFDPAAGATANVAFTPTTESLSDVMARGGAPKDSVAAIPGLGAALGVPEKKPEPTGEIADPFKYARDRENLAAKIDAARAPGASPKLARHGAEETDIEPSAGGVAGPAPAPAPRYVTQRAADIKGSDIRTGYVTEKSGASDMVPGALERVDANLAARKDALGEQADATLDTLERQRGRAAEEAIRLDEARIAAEARMAKMAAAQAQLEQNQQALDAEHEQIQKLEVNPNHYWEDKGTGGKILAAIGLIAGGIQSGMRGGPNQFLDFIRAGIRDDVQLQMDKIAARRQGYQTKQTRLDAKAALYRGDLELAKQELTANSQAMAAAMMRKYAAEDAAAEVRPALLLEAAKLDDEANKLRLDTAGKYGGSVKESFQFTPDRTVQVGGAPAPKESDIHQLAADEEKAGIGEKEGDYGATRDLISQLPEGELPTIDTRNVASRALRGTLNFLGGTGAASAALDTPAERRAVAQVEKIKGKLRHELSGAAVNAQEQEKLDQQLDGINTRAGLAQFADDIRRRTERRKSGIRAGFKAEVVQEYERRKGGYQLPGRASTLRGE